MTGRTTWAVAVLGAAAALTLAACGGSSGGHPTNLASLAGQGTGAATGTQSAIATSTLGAPGKPGSKTTAGSHTSAAGGHSSSSAARGGSGGGGGGNGGGGNGGGGNGGGGSHSTAPASNCATSTGAGAVITVCPATGLHDGQTVNITGHGFDPKYLGGQLLAVQCRYLGEQATRYGASQCNVNPITFAGATQTSTKNGDVSATLTVKVQFKSINCATEECLISVSPPNPNPPSTDNPHVLIKFG